MDFKTLANTRYSVRKFSSKIIKDDTIDLIIETARKAPSAVNFQPYKLFVVKSKQKLEELKECYHRSWIKSASIIMVVVSTHDMAWKRAQDGKDYSDIDAAIFIDHIMLQAADLGVGSCWVCNFEIDELRETLDLKADEEPIAIIPMGYPENDEIPVKKRKGVDDIVVWI